MDGPQPTALQSAPADRVGGNRNPVVFSEESQKKKGMPIRVGTPLVFVLDRLNPANRSIHVVISAVAAAAAGLLLVVLGHVGDQGVGGQEQVLTLAAF